MNCFRERIEPNRSFSPSCRGSRLTGSSNQHLESAQRWFFFCGPLRAVCISAPHSSPMTRSDLQSEKNGGPTGAAGSHLRVLWDSIQPLDCLRSFILLLRCAATPAAAVGSAALGATLSRCRIRLCRQHELCFHRTLGASEKTSCSLEATCTKFSPHKDMKEPFKFIVSKPAGRSPHSQ